jgi:hypothetical protein
MIDIKQARSQYDLKTGQFNGADCGVFAKYSPAYVVSNENLSLAMAEMRPQGKSVLTVAGSGDQPIFFKLYGATYVDTFDLSYCAKAIMDIKTAAIQKVSYQQYLSFLYQLFKSSHKIQDLSVCSECLDLCPEKTQQFIYGMAGCKICRDGYTENIPSKDEYEILQQRLKQPFNFIWSDLQYLPQCLNKTYDQIYLSNILQYNCDFSFMRGLVTDLLKFVNPGGEIMLCASNYFTYDELIEFRKLQTAMERYAKIRGVKHKDFMMCMARKL